MTGIVQNAFIFNGVFYTSGDVLTAEVLQEIGNHQSNLFDRILGVNSSDFPSNLPPVEITIEPHRFERSEATELDPAIGGNQPKAETEQEIADREAAQNEELKLAKEVYLELFGKEADQRKGLKSLKAEILEKKTELEKQAE